MKVFHQESNPKVSGLVTLKQSRTNGVVVGREDHQSVFVCVSIKAVHLELVSDFSAKTYTAAIRSFITRRRMCHTFLSDNGTNFIRVDKLLKEASKHIIKEKLASSDIQ